MALWEVDGTLQTRLNRCGSGVCLKKDCAGLCQKLHLGLFLCP